MDRNELIEVLENMLEQAGYRQILDEMVAGFSTDELRENVRHLNQNLFGNHYNTY